MLGAVELVVEVGITEADIRTDGWPRANAKATHPGVAVSFDSKQGPLRFATAVFGWWGDNLRAVALGLEALRRVDRYGITRSGEQYRGWRALPAGDGPVAPNGFASKEDAARFILIAAGLEPTPKWISHLLDVPDALTRVFRAAARRTHPDAGGDTERFARLETARRMVES